MIQVGLAGGDLPYWRAKEAVRHAEVRLAGQVQANQALESRATSMPGWSVAGLLALGAGVVSGSHFLAASVSAACLGFTALLCVYSIVRREFRYVPGYDPKILLEDNSESEYEALVGLAKGYQSSVERNAEAFVHLKTLLAVAIISMALAPLLGLGSLLLFPSPPAASTSPPFIQLRVAPA
jgi:hypothetical protein